MRLAGRLQALIDINSDFDFQSQTPIDRYLRAYFIKRRFIGSKDRFYLKENFYNYLRRRLQCHWWCDLSYNGKRSPRMCIFIYLIISHQITLEELKHLCDGSKYAPSQLTKDEIKVLQYCDKNKVGGFDHQSQPEHIRFNLPEWLYHALSQSIDTSEISTNQLLDFLSHKQANTDLRLNLLKGSVSDVLKRIKEKSIFFQEDKDIYSCIRLDKDIPLGQYDFFNEGYVEVQDKGSQIVSESIGVKPGQRILDFCAGAGGKTLALAMHAQNKGKIVACDTSHRRLERAKTRLRRASVSNVQLISIANSHDKQLKKYKNAFDHVLLDVPCTGTGTLRRNPDLKYKLSATYLEELVAVQQEILQSACRFVANEGILTYVTCSLLKQENESQIKCFLANHENFEPITVDNHFFVAANYGGYVMPLRFKTDGFYFCQLQKKA